MGLLSPISVTFVCSCLNIIRIDVCSSCVVTLRFFVDSFLFVYSCLFFLSRLLCGSRAPFRQTGQFFPSSLLTSSVSGKTPEVVKKLVPVFLFCHRCEFFSFCFRNLSLELSCVRCTLADMWCRRECCGG